MRDEMRGRLRRSSSMMNNQDHQRMGCVVALGLVCGIACSSRAQCPYDLPGIAPAVEAYLAQNPAVPGIVIRIQRGSSVLYERAFGKYTIETQVPIASASKWIAGGVIMSLVDDGVITLDETLGIYLPAYRAPGLDQITFRMAFAHTSGLPGNAGKGLDDCNACLNDRMTTLQECAIAIAATGLAVDSMGDPVSPGSVFSYGGCSMQAAGAAAEIAAGVPWTGLLNQRLRLPLGVTTMTYGPGLNPRVAGGIAANARDYARFLEMVISGGQFQGQQVLSPGAVLSLLDDQTGDAPVVYAPPIAEPFVGYGVGCWVNTENVGGESIQTSSEGAFGFSPWIDSPRGSLGVFLVRSSNQDVRPLVEFVQQQVRFAIDVSPDVSGNGVVDFPDVARLLANWNRPSFPGAPLGPGPIGDVNSSGRVDFGDLTEILAAWGQHCS